MHTTILQQMIAEYTFLIPQEKEIEELQAQLRDGFNIDDGPFCQGLDEALQHFKVQREAYYGGTFTGNHVHKCLKVLNTLEGYRAT